MLSKNLPLPAVSLSASGLRPPCYTLLCFLVGGTLFVVERSYNTRWGVRMWHAVLWQELLRIKGGDNIDVLPWIEMVKNSPFQSIYLFVQLDQLDSQT